MRCIPLMPFSGVTGIVRYGGGSATAKIASSTVGRTVGQITYRVISLCRCVNHCGWHS